MSTSIRRGVSAPAHTPTPTRHDRPAATRRARATRPRSTRRRAAASGEPWCGGAPFDLDLTADELLRDLDPGAWLARRTSGGGA